MLYRVSACIGDVAEWTKSNRPYGWILQRHKVIRCGPTPARRQHQLRTAVGHDVVTPISSVRNLGIYIDSDTSMKIHISKTVSLCHQAGVTAVICDVFFVSLACKPALRGILTDSSRFSTQRQADFILGKKEWTYVAVALRSAQGASCRPN